MIGILFLLGRNRIVMGLKSISGSKNYIKLKKFTIKDGHYHDTI